jgi:hypothetical protein
MQGEEKTMTNEEKVSKESSQKAKREYRRPALVVYGNIREITKNVGNTGKNDGGKGATQKSQP